MLLWVECPQKLYVLEMSKYLVLGYFGYRTNQLDGQTVKTRDLYQLVQQQKEEVSFYDTQEFKYNKLSILKMFWQVIKCDTLIYLPAHNNLKYIFPFIFILSKLFRFEIHYYVVGGWLREFIGKLPLHKKMLGMIAGIHVETSTLKKELIEYYNFSNVDLFPNFRFFDFTPNRFSDDKLRLVFVARINRMKGLDWIFEFANYIATHEVQHRFSITLYGPINEDDREYFDDMLIKFPMVKYKGVLQPNEIYGTLNNYDVLLLPTHYYTEGLPGSIVDAYISGIPVVVTKWKHAHEFVEDGKTGFIVPFEDGIQQFIGTLLSLESNRELLRQLQQNALEKRADFAPPVLNV